MPAQCPGCGRRMFDVVREGDAEISIKCHICKHTIGCALDAPNGRITRKNTPQRGKFRDVIVTEQRALK